MSLFNNEHTVQRFDNEMNDIAKSVDNMGALAIDQLARAVITLRNEDPVAAHAVIARDSEINALDILVDEKLIQLIARRQPMAKDLREIVTLGKVSTELERAGDEARKIASLAVHLYEGEKQSPSDEILRDIYDTAEYVGGMLQKSMDAFLQLDTEQSLQVLRMADDLDSRLSSNLRRLSTFVLEDARNIGYFVEIVLRMRALERFGGHAKNIAGHVIFLATGKDVRHADLEEILQLLNK